jgi:hypothetical protein
VGEGQEEREARGGERKEEGAAMLSMPTKMKLQT